MRRRHNTGYYYLITRRFSTSTPTRTIASLRILPSCWLFVLLMLDARFRNCALEAFSSSTPNKTYGQTTKNVATQILQGAGQAVVDMNKYNIPLDEIELEWKAELVQKAAEQEARLRLACRSDRERFVDTVQITVERQSANQGLGIGLLELAGGRSDGLGITVVSEVFNDGPTSGKDIMIGDSISEVRLIRRRKQQQQQQTSSKKPGVGGEGQKQQQRQLMEQFDEYKVNTECFGYDSTVKAIQSLPDYNDSFLDMYQIVLKRIRRKPKVSVKLQYQPSQNEPDAIIELFAGENLRQAMLLRNIKLNDPLAKRFDTKSSGNCGAGGLCRTCAVTVLRGNELLNPQRLAEQQMLEDQPRWRLACKAIVGFGMQEGEMTIQVNPRQW